MCSEYAFQDCETWTEFARGTASENMARELVWVVSEREDVLESLDRLLMSMLSAVLTAHGAVLKESRKRGGGGVGMDVATTD